MKDDNREDRSFLLARSLLTGFIGGIFWSAVGVVMYYFNFTEITPKTFIFRSWKTSGWTEGWLGDVVSIFVLGIISILIAFIYYGLLKKVNSMWMGVIYGIIIWVIFFMFIQQMFPNAKQFIDLSKDTIISTLSLFILYGAFIGYSISYDYYDTQVLGKAKDTKKHENLN